MPSGMGGSPALSAVPPGAGAGWGRCSGTARDPGPHFTSHAQLWPSSASHIRLPFQSVFRSFRSGRISEAAQLWASMYPLRILRHLLGFSALLCLPMAVSAPSPPRLVSHSFFLRVVELGVKSEAPHLHRHLGPPSICGAAWAFPPRVLLQRRDSQSQSEAAAPLDGSVRRSQSPSVWPTCSRGGREDRADRF